MVKNAAIGPPKLPKIPGLDFAGTVEEADADSKFKAGDHVWGMKADYMAANGSWTEVTDVTENEATFAPKNLALDIAGAVPLSGLTAYTVLKVCNLKPGDRVLIHAGSGGVGSFAIQIAKNFYQAYVVTTSRNLDFCKELGADEVVDYTKEDFAVKYADQPFNAIVDPVGGETESKSHKLLAKNAVYSAINNGKIDPAAKANADKTWKDKKYEFLFGIQPDVEGLDVLAKLVDEGKLNPKIGSVLQLEKAGEAEQMVSKVSGKILIKIG